MGRGGRGRGGGGRGRGRGGRHGGGRHGGGAPSSAPPGGGRHGGGGPSSAPPGGEALQVTLTAGPAFYAKLADPSCPAPANDAADGGDSSTTASAKTLVLESWADLKALLAWFRDGVDADHAASVVFSPLLNKAQRAQVHSAAEAVGLGGLTTVSSGVGDRRHVAVVRRDSAAAAAKKAAATGVSAESEESAALLWRWAKEEGVECSRDEAAEALAGGPEALPPALKAVWVRRSERQSAVVALCRAVGAGDLEAVQAIAAAYPSLLKEGAYDEVSGVSPLALAAGEGSVAALEALLAAGADVNARDGAGAMALQIARKYEQSDAEGVLLRAGAVDPDASWWPRASDVGPPGGAESAEGKVATAAAAAAASGGERSGEQAPGAVSVAAAAQESANGEARGLEAAGEKKASSKGDSASARSVCGTDAGPNPTDVDSVAGDYVDPEYSKNATSPGRMEAVHGAVAGGAGAGGAATAVGVSQGGGSGAREAAHTAPETVDAAPPPPPAVVTGTVEVDARAAAADEEERPPEIVPAGAEDGGKGRSEIDAWVDEWSAWATKHSSSLLAGAGLAVVGAVVFLWTGRGRRGAG